MKRSADTDEDNKLEICDFNDSSDAIRLKKVASHLDRIQLSVFGSDIWYSLVDHLTNIFGKPKTSRTGSKTKKLVKQFNYSNGTFEVVPYINRRRVISISISDPDDTIQHRLVKVLSGFPISVSVSQVEFAIDFYPDRQSDMAILRHHLSHVLYLKHSRVDCYNEKCGDVVDQRSGCRTTTSYLGLTGNVRKGSKGVRCYGKSDEALVRVELQANRRLLKRLKINLPDLPIGANDIDVLDYLDFRRFDDRLWGKLVDCCCRKHLPGFARMTDRRKAVMGDAIESGIRSFFQSIFKQGSFHPSDLDIIPVSEIISAFKALRKEYGFTAHWQSFFPRNDKLSAQIRKLIDTGRGGCLNFSQQ